MRTLAETLAMVNIEALNSIPKQCGRVPRLLDVACGTGVLLWRLLIQMPDAEAYGVDASADMLAQAHATLKGQPHVHLEHMEIGSEKTARLPYPPETFDLITCTNALHDLSNPEAVLSELHRLLAPGGQLVVEDFARRDPPFPWPVLEWLLRQVERKPVRAYTLDEAHLLCERIGLHVASRKAFAIDWFWRGWVVRASGASPEVSPVSV